MRNLKAKNLFEILKNLFNVRYISHNYHKTSQMEKIIITTKILFMSRRLPFYRKVNAISFCRSQRNQIWQILLYFEGIQQTLQKKTVGFIPQDGITVGRDRISQERDQILGLFFAPTPKNYGNFTVFLLTFYKRQ